MRVWPNGGTTAPAFDNVTDRGFRCTREYGVAHELTTHHRGIDLVGFAIIHAADDGVVIWAGPNGTAGHEVAILHDDGYTTRYLHNLPGSIRVKRGQHVKRGQAIAVLGASGFVTGPHCHFEVIQSDRKARINPRDYIAAGQPAGGGGTPIVPAPVPPTKKKRTTDMLLAHIPNKFGTGRHEYLIFGALGAVQIFRGEGAARAFEAQIGAPSAPVGQSFFDKQVDLAGGVQKFELVNADEVGGVTLNVTGQK